MPTNKLKPAGQHLCAPMRLRTTTLQPRWLLSHTCRMLPPIAKWSIVLCLCHLHLGVGLADNNNPARICGGPQTQKGWQPTRSQARPQCATGNLTLRPNLVTFFEVLPPCRDETCCNCVRHTPMRQANQRAVLDRETTATQSSNRRGANRDTCLQLGSHIQVIICCTLYPNRLHES